MSWASELGDVKAGCMGHVNDKCIRENNKLKSLCFKLHDVRYFVPAKSNKTCVIFWNVFANHYVWLIIWLPLYLKNLIDVSYHHFAIKFSATFSFILWKKYLHTYISYTYIHKEPCYAKPCKTERKRSNLKSLLNHR